MARRVERRVEAADRAAADNLRQESVERNELGALLQTVRSSPND